MALLFKGETRPTFPTRRFDAFLDGEVAALRQPGAPARRVFRDDADANLLLVIGRRGAAFYFKGRTRSDDEGRRKDLMLKLGAPATLTIAGARAAADKVRTQLADRHEPETERARRRAARSAADEREEERRLRREAIDALLQLSSRAPTAPAISALSDATLTECATAYGLHGFDLRRVSEERRDDVLVQLRLAIAECGAGSKAAADLDALTIDHAMRGHTNSTARKRISALRGLYKWLCRYGVTSTNPADNCEPVPPPPVRERYADDRQPGSGEGELQALWNACDRLPQARADFLRLLILLPLRRDELADAKVSNISTNLGILQITVPKPRSKTGTEHRLPIVGEAATIVRRLMQGRQPDDFLIPLTETGKRFDAWTAFKNQIRRESGQGWFYFHCTRKMFSTEAMEHGLEEHAVIDGLLNHAASLSVQGSARSYNFAKMMPRRAELLREWEKVVLHNVTAGKWPREEGNVIGFDPAARGLK